ncbi:hypothetical protein BH23ACT5_BH23ACT5_22610 [soil metagenome]
MRRRTLVRVVIFAATTVAAWGILAYGLEDSDPSLLQPGQLAPRDFVAVSSGMVTHLEDFQRAQDAARESVDRVSMPRDGIEEQVLDSIDGFFALVSRTVIGAGSESPTTTTTEPPLEETTTTTTTLAPDPDEDTDPEEPPPTTVPPAEVTIVGFLFIDSDGDGEFNPELAEDAEPGEVADVPLPNVGVVVSSPTRPSRVEAQSDGSFMATAAEGQVTVAVDEADPEFPGFSVSAGALVQTLECSAGVECQAEPVGFDPELLSVDAVEAALSPQTLVPDEAIRTLAALARQDVVRTAVGGDSHTTVAQQAAIGAAQTLFGQRVFESAAEQGLSLEEAKIRATEPPPLVFYNDIGVRDVGAGKAAGDVVANFLLPNWTFDDAATAERAEEEAEAVRQREEEFQVEFAAGEPIASEGDQLTQLQIDAIRETGGVLQRGQREGGLLAVLAILSAVLALYLNRFRPEFWAKPRMVALLGILIVLASGAVRIAVALEPTVGWYALPAVAFGLMASVLFDARIGVLMALSMAILAAAGTRDPGVAVYALLATMAPIGFVSAVSTRRAFRNAAVYSALAAGVIAAATSWFFHTGPQEDALLSIGRSVGWAFGVSLVAALIGLAALQFFESAFDITTTLGLLDLTDRNHEALQLLQEKAFGSFNHSLMVGTLADAAARSIGANPLLARASAYYHDLGKTENPTLFIENQFGISNPHDELTPEESAEVIRRHVTDGVRLAKQFKIPSEVAEAIVSHHGDAIMRFFYEKARESNPDVDPNRYRHVGHKPRTAETAIVMLADSLEASCRAVFQHEEPSPEAIEKVVNRVVDEKVNDGQLSDSPLTLAQLTEVRRAFLGSLVGHYHQRITYPNFPGS